MLNTENILQMRSHRLSERGFTEYLWAIDIVNIPNYIKEFNTVKDKYDELKALGTPAPDLRMEEVKAQHAMLKKMQQQLQQSYDLTLQIEATLKENINLTREIMEIQNIQFLLLQDINSKIDAIEQVVLHSMPEIIKGINSVALVNQRINIQIDQINSLTNLISEDIEKINRSLKETYLLTQINRPYHFLIYASETCDYLSQALSAESSADKRNAAGSDEDVGESKALTEMLEFAREMSQEGPNGILFNIDILYNELAGRNINATSTLSEYSNHIIASITTTPPGFNSALSFLVASVARFAWIMAKGYSALVMCNYFIGKNMEKTCDHLTAITRHYCALIVEELQDKVQMVNNGTLLSSLYATKWREFDLNEQIPSREIRYQFQAETGNVLTGFEFYAEGKRLFAKFYEAKILKNYIIADTDKDDNSLVKTTSVDVTDIFFGQQSWPSKSICNNDIDTPSAGKTKDRRFNDDHLITEIVFYSEYEGTDIFFNYDTYASAYDPFTGSLSTQPEQATAANSTIVTTVVRGIADEFYRDLPLLPSGVPLVRLVERSLSPLRGFYLFVQGGDIQAEPLICLTDVFIDRQIELNTLADIIPDARLKSLPPDLE